MVSAQDEKTDRQLLDSLIKFDPLLRSLDSLQKPVSYGLVSLTFGNKLFSNRNNQVNVLQEGNKFVVTPSLGYYHKSGIGLNVAANLFSENSKTAFYQYSITPSYDYLTNENFDAGLSYTRYFVKEEYSLSISPIQHDVYGYFNLRNNWVVPGLSFGYAAGKFTERIKVDTTIGLVTIHFTDTIRTSIKSFSLSGSLDHTFKWFDVLSANDAVMFKPQFLITAGTNTYNETHRGATIFQNLSTRRKNRINRFNEQSENSGMKLQSISLALTAGYMVKNFNIRPNFYLDYYLPETTGKRLAGIFSISISYSIY